MLPLLYMHWEYALSYCCWIENWAFELLEAPIPAPPSAPAPAPMAAPRPPPIAAPSPAPSTVVRAAAPRPRVLALSAWPATDCWANCLQTDWSYWNASNGLPGPGMTLTVGPIGVCAQAPATGSARGCPTSRRGKAGLIASTVSQLASSPAARRRVRTAFYAMPSLYTAIMNPRRFGAANRCPGPP